MNFVRLRVNDTVRRAGSAVLSHSRTLLLRILLIVMLSILAAAALLAALVMETGIGWLLMLSLVAGLVAVFSAAASRVTGSAF